MGLYHKGDILLKVSRSDEIVRRYSFGFRTTERNHNITHKDAAEGIDIIFFITLPCLQRIGILLECSAT